VSRLLRGLLAAGLVAASLSTGAGTAAGDPVVEPPVVEPPVVDPPAAEPPAAGPPAGIELTDAQFRWGINRESGNAAFAPGTVNLFSAGRIPSTGPNQPLTEDRWAATAGDVRIEKRQADGSYALATWAGTRTTPTGQPLTSAAAGLSSEHEVVIDGGTGTVDLAAGTAELRWDGDFTVALYSGLTFFYVADPVLRVSEGRAELTAVLGGYATDMAGTRWDALPETEVVMARLGTVALTEDGVTGTPDYLGVAYDPPAGSGSLAQAREGDSWGSFPAAFVDHQVAAGQGAYWYSSGGSTDRFKVPLPLAVSFDASRPVPGPVVPPPVQQPQVPVNPVREPPAPRPAAPPAATAPAPASSGAGRPPATARAPAAAAPAAAPAPTPTPATAAPALPEREWTASPATVRVNAQRDLSGLLPGASGEGGWWAVTGVLLVLSLVVGLVSSGRLTLRRSRR
jgi:hypothetical protein